MTPPRISDDPKAPFGYDEDSHVIAPFGMKADGTPRLSNRGRTVGEGFGAAKKKAPAPAKKKTVRPVTKPSAAEQSTRTVKGPPDYRLVAAGLFQLGSIPFKLLGSDPGGFVSRTLGEKQTLALRGDAAIISMFAQPMGNALGSIAAVNPWLAGKLEGGDLPREYIVLAVTAANLAGALISNHRAPSTELADMAQEMAEVQATQIRRNIAAMKEEEEHQAAMRAVQEQEEDQEDQEQEEDQEEDYPRYEQPAYDPGPGERTAQIPGQQTVYDYPAAS